MQLPSHISKNMGLGDSGQHRPLPSGLQLLILKMLNICFVGVLWPNKLGSIIWGLEAWRTLAYLAFSSTSR